MKFDRLIQLIRDELSREGEAKRIHELLSLLQIIKDERIKELEKQITKTKLERYRKIA